MSIIRIGAGILGGQKVDIQKSMKIRGSFLRGSTKICRMENLLPMINLSCPSLLPICRSIRILPKIRWNMISANLLINNLVKNETDEKEYKTILKKRELEIYKHNSPEYILTFYLCLLFFL